MRKALHADLRRRDLERERELRRRIVDYLYERARQGDPLLAIDMAHLIENAAIRWGFGWEGSVDYRIDDVRPGDADEVGASARRAAVRRLVATDPAVLRARRPSGWRSHATQDDRLCGYMVCMSAGDRAGVRTSKTRWSAPGSRMRAADARLGDSVLWHDSVDFTGDRRGRVQAMLGMAGVLRSGVEQSALRLHADQSPEP